MLLPTCIVIMLGKPWLLVRKSHLVMALHMGGTDLPQNCLASGNPYVKVAVMFAGPLDLMPCN